ncbi:Panacea domain-containing protein [Adlercreutzia sp. ZJ473]|uniref:Panacea domain-containing protein n=1 Tax=Adlercreutzia sp. ZJ473 TaxID=2722822 RepID=UPI00155425FB|nr:type II toxin-antitoxin system antitoxin SocA domain-containing protein [Adlercreutzia sp. ZJ473]
MENPQTMQPKKPSASDVARYLLEKKGALTEYQLQKLLYYCQAWSLVVEGRPLFPEEIRAYEHGPAAPSVSMQHQRQYYVSPSDISGDSGILSESDTAFIDVVLAAYDDMSGQQLENLTHSENPWRASFNQLTGVNSSAVISHELMRSYYARLLTSTDEEQQRHHVPNFNHPKKLYVTSSDYDWLLGYLEE